ncbi:hypothetical protein GCM10009677_28500 [Sphaerisporangium rubeum]
MPADPLVRLGRAVGPRSVSRLGTADILQASLCVALTGAALIVFAGHERLLVALPYIAYAVLAFASPRAASVALIPIGLLVPMVLELGFGGDLVYVELTAAAVTGCVIVLAVAVGARALLGGLRPTVEHLPIAALAVIVLAGYFAPPVAVAAQFSLRYAGGRHFPGLVVCLLMLAVVVMVRPRPVVVVHAFVWSAVAVALFALACGYQSGERLRTLTYLSTCLGVVDGPAVVACLALARTRRAVRWLVPAAVCLACVVASESRSGVLAVVVGAVFVLVTGRPPVVRLAVLAAPALVAVASVSWGVGFGELLTPWRNEASIISSDVQRWEVLDFSLRLIVEHPLRGVGYGNLVQLIDYAPRSGERSGAHNDYLRVAAENGIPALVLLLVILLRGVRPRRAGDAGVVRAVVVSSMAWIGTDLMLPHPAWSSYLWVCLACLLAMRTHRGESPAAVECREPRGSPAGRPVNRSSLSVPAAAVE